MTYTLSFEREILGTLFFLEILQSKCDIAQKIHVYVEIDIIIIS